MAMRKHKNAQNEIIIFDDAIIHKRGNNWHFRMWMMREQKYVRKSLQTADVNIATDKAKKLYLSLYAEQEAGKTYYSITVEQGVERYLKYREADVAAGLIVKERLVTIRAHLQHWQSFIGKKTKLSELTIASCEDYFIFRTTKSVVPGKQVTIENEQSTINACMKYLFKQGLVHVPAFEFRKLKKIDRNNEDIRRATFTEGEYYAVVKYMRDYTARAKHKLDDDTYRLRMLVRLWILVAANSGLRSGEQRQLQWSAVDIETHEIGGKGQVLARIRVRPETSKVRESRTLICRGGTYFERLRKIQKPTSKYDLIFSLDGKTEFSKRTLTAHFHKIVAGAGITDAKMRGIVPYSLRHFMVTQRVMSGLSYSDVAEMCGTSSTEVENTYNHLNDAKRLTNAVATYTRTADGLIIPQPY
jgi:integrase